MSDSFSKIPAPEPVLPAGIKHSCEKLASLAIDAAFFGQYLMRVLKILQTYTTTNAPPAARWRDEITQICYQYWEWVRLVGSGDSFYWPTTTKGSR